MAQPLVIDLGNLFNPEEVARRNMDYVPLGRPVIDSKLRAAAV
jgi:hypothetical protein